MRIRTTAVALVLCSFLWNTSAIAQEHLVDPAAMRQALAEQAATDRQNRETVLGVLEHSQVRELAGRLGLNVMGAEAAVSTLDSTELASLAEQARAADAQLAGGSNTVVISTTTLLIIVLIVVLLAR